MKTRAGVITVLSSAVNGTYAFRGRDDLCRSSFVGSFSLVLLCSALRGWQLHTTNVHFKVFLCAIEVGVIPCPVLAIHWFKFNCV